MAKILLDVSGWRSLRDFETGELVKELDPQIMAELHTLTAEPYPGDLVREAIPWTTRAALRLEDYYHPDFMFINYATPLFEKLNLELTQRERRELDALLFAEVKRFFEATDYQPVIVCAGGMVPLRGGIDTGSLKGFVCPVIHSGHYAGVYDATDADRKCVQKLPHLTSVIAKEEFLDAFPQMSEYCKRELPDLMLTCEEGYTFNEYGVRRHLAQMVPSACDAFGVYTSLPTPMSHILDVRGAIDAALDAGKRVALVVLEAVDPADFPFPMQPLSIALYGHLTYEHNRSYYAALLSGQPFYVDGMPTLLLSLARHVRERKDFPLSHIYNGVLIDSIGRRADKRTAAAGSRSVVTHSLSLCDISLECHSRNLAESGVCLFLSDKFLAQCAPK